MQDLRDPLDQPGSSRGDPVALVASELSLDPARQERDRAQFNSNTIWVSPQRKAKKWREGSRAE
jgi:hypothetical protein